MKRMRKSKKSDKSDSKDTAIWPSSNFNNPRAIWIYRDNNAHPTLIKSYDIDPETGKLTEK